MRQIVFSLVYWFAFYVIAMIAIGGIAGGLAGRQMRTSQEAAQAGSQAGVAAGKRFQTPAVIGTGVMAVFGSIAGVLPGTRRRTSIG